MRLLLVLTLLLAANAALAWDGDWTQGRSGTTGYEPFYDPKSSHGDAGTKERPQTFLKPPPREAVDVDPEELGDYFDRRNKDTAPYALARIPQTLRYNQVVIPKGYYLVKAGDLTDGSPRVNLKTPMKTQEAGKPATGAKKSPDLPPLGTDTDPPDRLKGHLQAQPVEAQPAPLQVKTDAVPYQVFVIKRLGRVVAVVPIHRMESHAPSRKDKLPKHALAWVETENRRPVLKFYYKKRIYTTEFQ